MVAVDISPQLIEYVKVFCDNAFSETCDACTDSLISIDDATNDGKQPITSFPEQVFCTAWNHLNMDGIRCWNLYLHPQYSIKNFRADFMVSPLDYFVNHEVRFKQELLEKISTFLPRYVIEIDGFEWHDKTLEQAERDRQRERIIQLAGYTVVRFSAREILRDPMSCAREVFFNRVCNDIHSVFHRLTVVA